MITLLSDLHGEFSEEFEDYLKNAKEDDLLIILGDVGLWFPERDDWELFTERFLSLPQKIAIVDGNHENFKKLFAFPKIDWCGGKARRISKNILLLGRGEIYSIEGKTFFTMGGCYSSDKWRERGLWQPEEMPTTVDFENAYANLRSHGNRVDYVLTHYYNERPLDPINPNSLLRELFKYIDKEVLFKKWYLGHWHHDFSIDEKHHTVYRQPIRLI